VQAKVVAGVENRKQKLERTRGQHNGKFDDETDLKMRRWEFGDRFRKRVV
jgi:hypothetical protein